MSLLLREKLDASERAARQLADACFGAWGTLDHRASGVGRTANLIMDCSYVSSTSARLLSHADEYQLHLLSMHVAVCRRVARQTEHICADHADPMLSACAGAARLAIVAFNDLLGFLWDQQRTHVARSEHETDADRSMG
jgi:hypothetical protein